MACANNLTSLPLTATGEWIPVNATVSQDNQLLSTGVLDVSEHGYKPKQFPVATVSAGNNTAIAQAAGPNRQSRQFQPFVGAIPAGRPVFGSSKLLAFFGQPASDSCEHFGTFGTTSSFESQILLRLLSLFAMRTPNSLLGVSYIVASGDFGSGFPVGNCASFDASFPATCPFVIAVGGTEFIVDAVTEAAWVSSDGSFSNIFQRAKYQDAAVEAYFRTVGANASSPFNVSGRAGPLRSIFHCAGGQKWKFLRAKKPCSLATTMAPTESQKSQKVRERDKNPPPMAEREDLDAQYLRFSDGKEGVAKILEYMKTSGADGDEGE
ncbi:hypothetical protein B0H14DRAFT_2559708 [Mycena olivaceomarginata]|nr:hypothetical protein B0H14DRAFT_2559708 [Mycena olivaceomarginata]